MKLDGDSDSEVGTIPEDHVCEDKVGIIIEWQKCHALDPTCKIRIGGVHTEQFYANQGCFFLSLVLGYFYHLSL